MQSVLFTSYTQETLTNSKCIIYFIYSRNYDKCEAYNLLHLFKKLWQMQTILCTIYTQETLTHTKLIIYFKYSRNSDKWKAYYLLHVFKKFWQKLSLLFTSYTRETLTNAKLNIYFIFSRIPEKCNSIIYLMYSRISDKCKACYLLHVLEKLWEMQSVLFTSYIQEIFPHVRILLAVRNTCLPHGTVLG